MRSCGFGRELGMTKPLIVTDPGLASLPFIQATILRPDHVLSRPFGESPALAREEERGEEF